MSRRQVKKNRPWIVQYREKPVDSEEVTPWRYLAVEDDVTAETAYIVSTKKDAARLSLEDAITFMKACQKYLMEDDGSLQMLNVWTKEIIPVEAL